MARRRTFLIIFVVLILVLAIGVGALFLMGGDFGRDEPEPSIEVDGATPTPEIRTKRVVVAVQTIPRGMRIPPDAVALFDWPEKDLPEDPIYELEDVVGMVARVEISRERPISDSKVKVVFLGEGSEFSLAIKTGRVAIAVPVTALSAVGNALRPGDRVDVLVSFSIVEVDEDSQIKLPLVLVGGEDCLAGCQPTGEQKPRVVTQYTVQDALVLGVGLWKGEVPELEAVRPSEVEAGVAEEVEIIPVAEGAEAVPPPEESIAVALTDIRVITLEVEPQQALVLKWLRETNTSVDLVMRSAIDDGDRSTEAVTLQYMIDRYHISLPPKLPHTPENEFDYSMIDTSLQYSAPPAQ